MIQVKSFTGRWSLESYGQLSVDALNEVSNSFIEKIEKEGSIVQSIQTAHGMVPDNATHYGAIVFTITIIYLSTLKRNVLTEVV